MPVPVDPRATEKRLYGRSFYASNDDGLLSLSRRLGCKTPDGITLCRSEEDGLTLLRHALEEEGEVRGEGRS